MTFWHISSWISHRHTCPFHPEPCSYLPSHPTPPGGHWAPALGVLRHTSKLHWLSMLHCLALPFFGIGMKTDFFQSCGHCWVFLICWHIGYSTFTASSFRIWNSSTGIPSPPLALFTVILPKAHLISHYNMSGSRWPGFRKGRGIRDHTSQHLLDHKKKKRERESSRKTATSALLTMLKPLTVWITTNCGKFLKRWEY